MNDEKILDDVPASPAELFKGVFDLPHKSPVRPVQLSLDDKFRFRCHEGIACFNECCKSIDIVLTPYDILRLKTRLELTSNELIQRYTVPYDMDAHGLPGLKLSTQPSSTACIFLTDEGCGVYGDRPSACRYYALGMVSMRKKDSAIDEEHFFVVKEDHCRGHYEPHTQTVREYRREQGVDVYDEMNRGWRQVVLKKRSCGPTVGKPTERSLQLFLMASYDTEGFREFIKTPSFSDVFDLDEEIVNQLMNDDVELMKFSHRFLKQVLFGEITIPLKEGAGEKRLARRRALRAKHRAQKRG